MPIFSKISLAILFSLLLISTDLFAANRNLKYPSRNNFAPSPPIASTPEVTEAPITKKICGSRGVVCIELTQTQSNLEVKLSNTDIETKTITLKLWSDNAKVTQRVDSLEDIVLEGGKQIHILSLVQLDNSRRMGYNFNFNSNRGNLKAIHNDSYVYDLPYETNKSYKLIQGYGGKFSHRNQQNYYAYDFRMPVGKLITAARGGKVVEVVEKYRRGGRNPLMYSMSNYIYIEHDDGTVGIYSHLDTNGVIVKAGEIVQKGQNIAYSGSTGFVDVPHLHFSVGKFLKGEKLQSFPVKVNTSKGVLSKLKKYEFYEKP